MKNANTIKATDTYQLLPPMTPAEFASLKSNIGERGVVVPIDIDENGEILDDHHRYLILSSTSVTLRT